MVSVSPIQDPTSLTAGGRLVSTDGRVLPLEGTSIRVDAAGGIARVIVEQRFRNPHAEALHVKYLLPIPAEGAISGFSFKIGDQRIIGEIDRKRRARERFNQAIAEGKTAALLEETRSTVFQEEVGNIPPGQKLVAEVVIDQKLIWIHDGAWEWRFPTVIGARYMGPAGRVSDAAKLHVDASETPLAHRLSLVMNVQDRLNGRFESPSHGLEVVEESGRSIVTIGDPGTVRLDRDVVVRWPVSMMEVGASMVTSRPADADFQGRAYGLVTLVPPDAKARTASLPRDLIFLIDTSGSMDGEPLNQAKRVVSAMIDTLEDADRLELIEFSNYPRRFREEAIVATRDGKKAAIKWVQGLRASGSTEMKDALLSATATLRSEAQRQIVLITDGYIGSEQEIVKTVLGSLPRGSRLHTVGVGSAVNRSLTEPLARAGAGIEVIVALGEDAERAAERLIARTVAPLVTELRVEGPGVVGTVPVRIPDLFARSPVIIAAELNPDGGDVIVRGKIAGGEFVHTTRATKQALGAGNGAITALFGRELVADLEMRAVATHKKSEIEAEIERIGLVFQIATRLTSWVAISDQRTIEHGTESRRETMPHEIPHGVSVAGMGLRGLRSVAAPAAPGSMAPAAAPARGAVAPSRLKASVSFGEEARNELDDMDEDLELSGVEAATGDLGLDQGDVFSRIVAPEPDEDEPAARAAPAASRASKVQAPKDAEPLEAKERRTSGALPPPAKAKPQPKPEAAPVPSTPLAQYGAPEGQPQLLEVKVTRKRSPLWLIALLMLILGLLYFWLKGGR